MLYVLGEFIWGSISDFKFHTKHSDCRGGIKPCLQVYKFNEEGGEWVVKGLGDQVMSVGDGFCFSVLAKDFDGMKRNCAYFADCCFYDGKDDDFQAGILACSTWRTMLLAPWNLLKVILKFSGLPQPGSGKHQLKARILSFNYQVLVQFVNALTKCTVNDSVLSLLVLYVD